MKWDIEKFYIETSDRHLTCFLGTREIKLWMRIKLNNRPVAPFHLSSLYESIIFMNRKRKYNEDNKESYGNPLDATCEG